MQLITTTLFFSVLFAGSLSAAGSKLSGQDVPKKAIFERAIPQIGAKTIIKRATPTIGDGIDLNDCDRGGILFGCPFRYSAFSLTLDILKNAVNTVDSSIFAKYFDVGDKDVVLNVFKRLAGDDGSGAAELANIVIRAGDDPDDPAPATLENYNDPNPDLIISDDAWQYQTRDDNPDPCGPFDEGMTDRMYLLGSVLVNAYVEWDWFLANITGGHIFDQPNGYGWKAARALPKNCALFNANSYAWFATESYWAVDCSKDGGWDAPADDE